MHAPGNGPVFAVYYSALAAFGVPDVSKNEDEGRNVVVVYNDFSKAFDKGRCGLAKCITRYLVFMAVADLLVIITAVILSRLRAMYFPVSFLSTIPACKLIILLSWASKDTSVWLTVAFTFDRFIAICCHRRKLRYCTEKNAAAVIGVVCAAGCLKNVPSYFIYVPVYVVDNVPWFCTINQMYYSSIAWRVYDWLHRMLNPCVPFLLIFLLNVLTIRYILKANEARKRLRAQSNGDRQNDTEMENRRKSIILLMAISGSFLLLRLTYVVNFLFVQLTSNNYASGSNSADPKFILQESGYMLELLSSCTNSCIYAGTQIKFRRQLKGVVQFPFKLIKTWFKTYALPIVSVLFSTTENYKVDMILK
ncbi:probable G-protein coupled receptor 139 [Leucoraja erinacea]|uniref:probable G-protein coupled receptor 139 n=1 Tax=Leucoraja erinaceus TaxID=7782 RepID=UPI0024549E1D|nr:probable G-protein coupled receptor 139 [Leucoraja erinacea]